MVLEKNRRITKKLLDWYRRHRRDLPWRRTRDPYKIWISEIMLQQTQVKTTVPYYRRFLARFPDIYALAAADLQDVLKLWEGLGYYGRARNMHRAAKEIVATHDGAIPDDMDKIKNLPGVGDYIAAAVLSIAYNQPHPVVDGNVKRVFARLFRIDAPVNVQRSYSVFKKKSEELMPPDSPADYNQALMELGALVCRPATPLCAQCPLRADCLAFEGGSTAEFPKKIKRKPLPEHTLVIAVVVKNNRVLLTRRQEQGLLGGLWEFPNGRLGPGESPEAACPRVVKTKLNLTTRIEARVAGIRHAYTHFKIKADVFVCRHVGGRVRLNGPADYRWIALDEIDAYPLPKANHKFLPALRRVLNPKVA